jgi:1,4-dihydroxy-2-naphthoate octaprenyltransferase
MDIKPLDSVLRLLRVRFLLGGALFFLAGLLFAVVLGAPSDPGKFLLGYLIFLTGHLSISFSNDYFDFPLNRLTGRTVLLGRSGALVRRPFLRQMAIRIAIVLILVSIVLAAVFLFLYAYSLWFFLFVILGNFAGWSYSAPPLRFSYRGLGELLTVVGAGIFMPGMGYFVATGTLDLPFVMFALPLFAYGVLLILAVEIPDREGDRLGGKQTFVVRFGRNMSFQGIAGAALGATMLYVLYSLSGLWSPPVNWTVLAGCSLIPLLSGVAGLVRNTYQRPESIPRAIFTIYALIGYLALGDLYLLVISLA